MPFLGMNGWKMHYEKVGEGKETLVFVHGNGSSEKWWNKIKPLLPTEWSSYFIDLRGFGESDNQKPYTIEQFSKDINKFVTEMGIAHFHYVGHSLGGVIGYMYALKFNDQLKSLILEDTLPATGFPMADVVKDHFKLLINDRKMLETNLRERVVAFLKDKEFFKNVILHDSIRSIPQAYTDTVDAICNINVLDDLRKIDTPTLFIHGEKDAVALWDWMRQTFNAFRNKQECVIKNSSHSPMIENPKEFMKCLKEFIGKETKQ
ncbi:MAG: alpha/beta fold hydrolase [Nitrospiraceae bacterium]|nr:alpha/beta fold hydrolase [Nitrospiraceae bacterium]